MNLETFFEKFNLFADAPDAVAKMRGLLIHFAVRGKLVSNDPCEEPVGLNLSGTSGDDFALPDNWRAGFLGEVFVFEYGDNLPAPKRSESGEYPVFGSNGVVGTHDTYLTKEPAVIVGRKGSAGALNIANGPSWTTDVAYFVRPPSDIDLRFTYYLFSTLRLNNLGKGIKPGLSRKEVYALPIALPPLAEQKRIVAKVDELMVLCDRLEAQQQERETRQAALARASLARFADAPTPANLNFIFHKSYDIALADLRKTILTLAVQGKLVPQDPNDEPAREFMRRLTSQRANGIENNSGPIEIQYEVPDAWCWVKLGDCVDSMANGIYKPAKFYSETGTACVRMFNIQDGRLDLSTLKRLDLSPSEVAQYRLEMGDLLVNRVNSRELVGKCAVVPANDEPLVFEAMNIRVRLLERQHLPYYLNVVLRTDRIRDLFQNSSKQAIGQASINQPQVASVTIPIPPLAEQRRIVTKVDELMALVDALETQLATARTAAGKLMEAVVAELTSQQSTRSVRCPRQSSLPESM